MSCYLLLSRVILKIPLRSRGLPELVGLHSATSINQYSCVTFYNSRQFPKATILFTHCSCHTHSQADGRIERGKKMKEDREKRGTEREERSVEMRA